jgi:DNA-binding MarR family transcriptional regulator
VSRLKARGLVEAAADPNDGRRTRVRIADAALQAITRRAARDINQVISHTIDDPTQATPSHRTAGGVG